MKRPPIRTLDLHGSPEQIGARHGSAYADEIRAYADERVGLVTTGKWSGGVELTRGQVLDLAEEMLPAHERFDAALHAEMLAMADAAGITPAEAIVGGGFTDFTDTVRARTGANPPPEAEEDDCTAVITPDGRSEGHGYYAQTWDMHDTATDYVLLLRLRPDDGPAATVFTTTGCLGQLGMNSEGVCVGINNLNCLDGQVAVTWPTVVRAMLRAGDATEALAILTAAPLAGAHNYLIFDRHGVGFNVEAMPTVQEVTALGDAPLIHTNHTLASPTSAVQAERAAPLLDSSMRRLAVAKDFLAHGPIDAERLFELTREPSAVCQVATPPYNIESSGAAVMRPATQEFWACWGRPAENDYVRIEVARPEGAITSA